MHPSQRITPNHQEPPVHSPFPLTPSSTAPLAAGDLAPDFTLPGSSGKPVSLSNYRGHPVILTFFPADWSSVCGGQLSLYNELLPEFKSHNAELLAISVDGHWSHVAFAKARKFNFPLLSDFQPRGAVAEQYGVFRPADGFAERALFVIDSEGIIRWSFVSPVAVNPGADGILTALEALTSPHPEPAPSPKPLLPISPHDHVFGAANAPVTLLEFGDFECPDCGASFPIVEALRQQQGDRLRFIFRHFPLNQSHTHAQGAAEAAEAAGAQGRFPEMYKLLFENQTALAPTNLLAYADQLDLPLNGFKQALGARTFRQRVREDFLGGVRSGVGGTPTFFINGKRYAGPIDLTSLTLAVNGAAL